MGRMTLLIPLPGRSSLRCGRCRTPLYAFGISARHMGGAQFHGKPRGRLDVLERANKSSTLKAVS